MSRNERYLVPLFRAHHANCEHGFHQEGMLAVCARQSVDPIVVDGRQLIQFVFTQAFAAQIRGTKSEASNHKHTKDCSQHGSTDCAGSGERE